MQQNVATVDTAHPGFSTQTGGIFAGLRLGGGVRYVGPTQGDAANSFRVPGHTLADAVIGCYWGLRRSVLASLSYRW